MKRTEECGSQIEEEWMRNGLGVKARPVQSPSGEVGQRADCLRPLASVPRLAGCNWALPHPQRTLSLLQLPIYLPIYCSLETTSACECFSFARL